MASALRPERIADLRLSAGDKPDEDGIGLRSVDQRDTQSHKDSICIRYGIQKKGINRTTANVPVRVSPDLGRARQQKHNMYNAWIQ